MSKWIKIHPLDNVAVALSPLPAGTVIETEGDAAVLTEEIPQGHKFSLRAIAAGEEVMKYGAPIGNATAAIAAGSHVHSHNLKTGLHEEDDYTYTPSAPSRVGPAEDTSCEDTFDGYVRPDGSVGIRNEIWIIPTVGCVNSVGQKLASMARERFADLISSSIDDVIAFQHPYGCSQLGDDQENTRKILAGLCSHPNAGGVLLLGLGCENSGVEEIKAYIENFHKKNIRCLICQEAEDELEESLVLLKDIIAKAAEMKRTPVPVSRLVAGVKCGGSDGLSGITANPLVGRFTDILTGCGGSVLMTEVPEMFGAETILLNRCEDEAVFRKTASMIQRFKSYFSDHGQPVYENPSPGNKAGGITTLEDKSLGCTQKAGNAPVRDVLDYGQHIQKNGLSLLYAPGNDLVSSTALAVSGAHLILFTTGRGTPFASPVPTVKISSNTQLHDRKASWIDFDAGTLTESGNYDALADTLYQYVIRVASGQYVKSEEAGYHDMAIFKQNITL